MRPAAIPAVLVIAGVVVAVLAGGSTAGTAVAVTLVGIAAVVAVSLVFYAVGRSEDREREREAATGRRPSRRSPGR
jgi:uncharacterized membrane protein YuzA (DUF378 family)